MDLMTSGKLYEAALRLHHSNEWDDDTDADVDLLYGYVVVFEDDDDGVIYVKRPRDVPNMGNVSKRNDTLMGVRKGRKCS